jgi:cytochrome c-type biogenesis protein
MIAEISYAYVLGLLSILSPCTFIIVPVMASDLKAKLKKILSFLAGITITFGVLGILSAMTGKLLTNFMGPYLYLFAGSITLIAGLNMFGIFDLALPSLFTNVKTKSHFMMGLLYGGVALSCVGPLMASVLVYITAKASIVFGFLMMYIFSLGFITPFVLCAYLMKDKAVCMRLMKHSGKIRKIGGIMLLLVSAYLLFVAFSGII